MDVALFIFLVAEYLRLVLMLSYTNILRVIRYYTSIEMQSLATEMFGNKILLGMRLVCFERAVLMGFNIHEKGRCNVWYVIISDVG